MDQPDGEGSKRERSRTAAKRTKSTSKLFIVVMAVCAALLIAVLVMIKRANGPSKASVVPITSSVPSVVMPLQLSETSFDTNTWRIKGVAKNTSDKVYEKVRITFRTTDDTGARGVAEAEISKIEPHGSSHFATAQVPKNCKTYLLPPEFDGTAR